MSDVAYPILRPRKLAAPNGAVIVGTVERILGCAEIDAVYRNPDGSISYDHTGHTDIDWDMQETQIRPNIMGEQEVVFQDENGDEWLEGELVFARDQDDTE